MTLYDSIKNLNAKGEIFIYDKFERETRLIKFPFCRCHRARPPSASFLPSSSLCRRWCRVEFCGKISILLILLHYHHLLILCQSSRAFRRFFPPHRCRWLDLFTAHVPNLFLSLCVVIRFTVWRIFAAWMEQCCRNMESPTSELRTQINGKCHQISSRVEGKKGRTSYRRVSCRYPFSPSLSDSATTWNLNLITNSNSFTLSTTKKYNLQFKFSICKRIFLSCWIFFKKTWKCFSRL